MEGRYWRVVRRRSDDGDDICRDAVLGRCQHHRLTSVMVAMRPRAGAEVTSDIKGAMVFIVASRMVPESGCTLPDTGSGRACSESGCVERHRNGTEVVTEKSEP